MNFLAWTLYLWFVVPRLATSPFFSLHYTVYSLAFNMITNVIGPEDVDHHAGEEIGERRPQAERDGKAEYAKRGDETSDER